MGNKIAVTIYRYFNYFILYIIKSIVLNTSLVLDNVFGEKQIEYLNIYSVTKLIYAIYVPVSQCSLKNKNIISTAFKTAFPAGIISGLLFAIQAHCKSS